MTGSNWLTFSIPSAFIILMTVQRFDAWRVKKALHKESLRVDVKLDEIHALVNSQMAKQKHLALRQAERIAALTKDPKDVALAKEALTAYNEHQDRQARVDAALALKLAAKEPKPRRKW